jgi:hypothetical protein
LLQDATPAAGGASPTRFVAWIALGAAVVGVFSTWTTDGSLTLNGTQGPNNGWLVVIVAGLALAWVRSMSRGSWVGVAGVLGTAVVIAWTAIESWLDAGEILGGSAGWGLILVLGASVALAAAAVLRGLELFRA